MSFLSSVKQNIKLTTVKIVKQFSNLALNIISQQFLNISKMYENEYIYFNWIYILLNIFILYRSKVPLVYARSKKK